MRYLLYTILLIFCFVNVASATDIYLDSVSTFKTIRHKNVQPKLYVPHFVLIGENATFKVFTSPFKIVTLTVDYGYSMDKIVLEKEANDKGVAVFTVQIINNQDFIGKSIGVDAEKCQFRKILREVK